MSRLDQIGTAARRTTVGVTVGGVRVGGDAPIVVQSMTNTDTADVAATTKQVAELARAGSELVRITVNTPEAAAAVPKIRERLDMMGGRRAADRRFPLQRPPAADRRTGLRRGAREVPHQSGQCRLRQETRHAVLDDHRDRAAPRQARAHRRQLGLARPVHGRGADGREPRARRAVGRRARGARGADPLGARFGRARRGTRHDA